jgi:DnaJ-class molecular chaperone
MKTHYETLGIPQDASAERVKASYRSLVKIYHPDTLTQGTTAHAEAEKRIREINVAYAVLANTRSRASYDTKLNRELPHPAAEPERCSKCGNPTTYWHTNRKAPLCHACTAKASEMGELRNVKRKRAGA